MPLCFSIHVFTFVSLIMLILIKTAMAMVVEIIPHGRQNSPVPFHFTCHGQTQHHDCCSLCSVFKLQPKKLLVRQGLNSFRPSDAYLRQYSGVPNRRAGLPIHTFNSRKCI